MDDGKYISILSNCATTESRWDSSVWNNWKPMQTEYQPVLLLLLLFVVMATQQCDTFEMLNVEAVSICRRCFSSFLSVSWIQYFQNKMNDMMDEVIAICIIIINIVLWIVLMRRMSSFERTVYLPAHQCHSIQTIIVSVFHSQGKFFFFSKNTSKSMR